MTRHAVCWTDCARDSRLCARRLVAATALFLSVVALVRGEPRLRSGAGRRGGAGVGNAAGRATRTRRVRKVAVPVADSSEGEKVVPQPALDAALDKIDGWVDNPRQADETGTLGMPPPGSTIVIDGASVAWAHGQHKRFSTVGLKTVIDFFLDKGYPSVMALLSKSYAQEPAPGSPRTRVSDDIPALLALERAGHVHLMPPGASEEGMLLQTAWSKEAFVVSKNDFGDFKRDCSVEEEEWLRTHHIYFSWHQGLFLPTCDRDDAAPRRPWQPRQSHVTEEGQMEAEMGQAAAAAAEEEETQRLVSEALPSFAWVPAGGGGLLRSMSTLSFFALIQSMGWKKVDEETVEALVQLTVEANTRANACAGETHGDASFLPRGPRVLVIQGRLGLISSVDFEGIAIDGGALAPSTDSGQSDADAAQVVEEWASCRVRASSALLAQDTIRHGDTVEFDAVYDDANAVWRATRLARTGCTLQRESRLVSAVAAIAHLMGFADHDEFARTDFSSDLSAPQIAEASAALHGAIFTTRHLAKNQAHVCQGVSRAAWLQTLFEPDDTVAAAAARAGLPLTVADYFAQVHAPLYYGNLPCLTSMAADSETVLFFPLEVCRVEYAPLAPPMSSDNGGMAKLQASGSTTGQKGNLGEEERDVCESEMTDEMEGGLEDDSGQEDDAMLDRYQESGISRDALVRKMSDAGDKLAALETRLGQDALEGMQTVEQELQSSLSALQSSLSIVQGQRAEPTSPDMDAAPELRALASPNVTVVPGQRENGGEDGGKGGGVQGESAQVAGRVATAVSTIRDLCQELLRKRTLLEDTLLHTSTLDQARLVDVEVDRLRQNVSPLSGGPGVSLDSSGGSGLQNGTHESEVTRESLMRELSTSKAEVSRLKQQLLDTASTPSSAQQLSQASVQIAQRDKVLSNLKELLKSVARQHPQVRDEIRDQLRAMNQPEAASTDSVECQVGTDDPGHMAPEMT